MRFDHRIFMGLGDIVGAAIDMAASADVVMVPKAFQANPGRARRAKGHGFKQHRRAELKTRAKARARRLGHA